MVDVEKEISQLDQVPIVRKFIDDFPDDLPGLPLYKEIEFCVDLVMGPKRISMAPYRMVPAKLRELKEQLQDLLDRVYSVECVFFGNPGVVCQEEGWVIEIV